MGIMQQILEMFGFSEKQYMIASVCMVVLLANFLGGLLYSIILASGGPIKPQPTTQRISFRLSMLTEFALVIFAAYYHAAVVNDVEAIHVVYWVFALAAAPLVAIIGAQVTGIVFASRIEAKKKAYRQWEARQRAKRMARAMADKPRKKRPAGTS